MNNISFKFTGETFVAELGAHTQTQREQRANDMMWYFGMRRDAVIEEEEEGGKLQKSASAQPESKDKFACDSTRRPPSLQPAAPLQLCLPPLPPSPPTDQGSLHLSLSLPPSRSVERNADNSPGVNALLRGQRGCGSGQAGAGLPDGQLSVVGRRLDQRGLCILAVVAV